MYTFSYLAHTLLILIFTHIKLYIIHLLYRHGSTELLAKIFPGLEKSPDAGFNVCLEFDADKYANNTVFLTNIADLKRHLLGGPLVQAFDTLVSGATPGPVTSFQFRTSEILYICPSAAKDKVTVIFLIDFNEGIDKAISKVFLQEFVEGQRAIRTAPPVSYTKEPPLELSSLKLAPTPTKSGYIAFSLEKRHVEGAKKDQAVTLLTGFRSYLLYHIKCTKTYLQMRMRKRVAGWLQVLNRAVPEVETEKKTAAGKTFTRKSVI